MDFTPVTRVAGKVVLKTRSASPKLLFAVGIVGVVSGTVLACRATLQLEKPLHEAQNKLDDLNNMEGFYSKSELARDRAFVYTELVMDLGKLYGPALICGGVGIAALTGSHHILNKRNAALTAAYAALEKSYNLYRDRVREEFGEDRERAFHYDVEKTILKTAGPAPKNSNGWEASTYARFFDEGNPNWKRTPEYNKTFLINQERFANDLLRARGYVFLNEVYESLGIPHSKAGAVCGWTVNDDPSDGDNRIDFGIFNGDRSSVRNFVNGFEESILLDFNVDGIILDKFERHNNGRY